MGKISKRHLLKSLYKTSAYRHLTTIIIIHCPSRAYFQIKKTMDGGYFRLTFFLNSGLPFLTVATNISPTPAAGKRFKRPRIPWTAMTYKFLAPKPYRMVGKQNKFQLVYLRPLFIRSLSTHLYYQHSSWRRLLANPERCGIFLPRFHHVLFI